jgi:hypothetical protein
MRSAFGVDHGEIYKGDPAKAERNRKTANSLAAIGGTSATMGAVTGGISVAEHKGKDPLGFLHSAKGYSKTGRAPSAAGKTKILSAVAHGHKVQAGVAGGLGAASLGLAGAYKHAQRKELAKSSGDRARQAGTIGVGGASVGLGGYNAQFLGRHVAHHQREARAAHHLVALHNMGEVGLGAKDLAEARKTRAVSGRVVGVKGAGALASAGIAAAGGKAIYDATKRTKKKRS